jgi:8-oxo-dGTP pyrophosphatase MutT (NUDIX family)
MNYVLGFIFDQTGENVLLIRNTRENNPYPGLLNGIGGKVEEEEHVTQAMERELSEETGIILTENDRWDYIVTMQFPDGVELTVFYIVLYQVEIFEERVIDEGTLCWLNVKNDDLLDVCNPKLAGRGEVSYFINSSRLSIMSSNT